MVDKRVSHMLSTSRTAANKSQEYMSLELNVARKTVQNWEYGVTEPSVSQVISWFKALEVPPLPYILEYIFPELDGVSADDEDIRIHEAFTVLINELPNETVRQLLYLFYGKHGSSPRGIMNMITAHLQSPMRDRISHGRQIAQDYDLASRKDDITSPEHVQPDMDFLHSAISEGESAFLNDEKGYKMF